MSATTQHHVARTTGPQRRYEPSPAKRARPRVPLPPLIALGMFGMVGLLALLPPKPDDGARAIAHRSLRVSTSADESIVIRNVADGAVLERISGQTESFVRGVFHSLDLLRRAHHVAAGAPYGLAELSDGRLVLQDPSTATRIDLEGFGPGNASQFTALLGLPALKAAP